MARTETPRSTAFRHIAEVMALLDRDAARLSIHNVQLELRRSQQGSVDTLKGEIVAEDGRLRDGERVVIATVHIEWAALSNSYSYDELTIEPGKDTPWRLAEPLTGYLRKILPGAG